MPTIDDAILEFAVSNNAATYAGQEDLSHAEVTVIAQRHGWTREDDSWEDRKSTSKGLVTRWLSERRIPMHQRTRRVRVEDLINAALTGRLMPTSPRILQRRAEAEKDNVIKRIMGLNHAVDQAKNLLASHDARRAMLEFDLERLEKALEAAKEEEQRLYDAGYRRHTFPRLD